MIDSQSAKTTGVGGPARGYDGAKRLKGRKRHLLVDTTGLVLLACVHGADLHDRDGARRLVETVGASELAPLELVWADQGYTGAFARRLHETRGWRLEVVRHPRPPALAIRPRGEADVQLPRPAPALRRLTHVAA